MSAELQDNVYKITREVKAPQQLLFDSFTQKDHLENWYRPEGFKLDFRTFEIKEGGISHHSLTSPDGWQMWELHKYKEVKRPGRLSYVHCFSNEAAETLRHPKMPNWPVETLITILFEQAGDSTRVDFHLTPHNASDEEIKAFNDGLANSKGGWNMAFDNLEKYISSK